MLEITDTGHWAYLKLDGVTLFAISLDGDSIEGKRSPEAELRISWLARLAGAWESLDPTVPVLPAPVTRTYGAAEEPHV